LIGSSVPFMNRMETGRSAGVTPMFPGVGTLAETTAYARAKSGVCKASRNTIDPPFETPVT